MKAHERLLRHFQLPDLEQRRHLHDALRGNVRSDRAMSRDGNVLVYQHDGCVYGGEQRMEPDGIAPPPMAYCLAAGETLGPAVSVSREGDVAYFQRLRGTTCEVMKVALRPPPGPNCSSRFIIRTSFREPSVLLTLAQPAAAMLSEPITRGLYLAQGNELHLWRPGHDLEKKATLPDPIRRIALVDSHSSLGILTGNQWHTNAWHLDNWSGALPIPVMMSELADTKRPIGAYMHKPLQRIDFLKSRPCAELVAFRCVAPWLFEGDKTRPFDTMASPQDESERAFVTREGDDFRLRILNVESGQTREVGATGPTAAGGMKLGWSADGSTLAVGLFIDKTISVYAWNLIDGTSCVLPRLEGVQYADGRLSFLRPGTSQRMEVGLHELGSLANELWVEAHVSRLVMGSSARPFSAATIERAEGQLKINGILVPRKDTGR